MSLSAQRAILLRGDPGLFDIIKKGLGFVAKSTPIGRVALPAISFIGGRLGRPQLPPIALPAPPRGLRFGPGGAPAIAPVGPAAGPMGAMGVGCPKGFHINRASYHTAAGFVERGTRCVRNRRRNLSNGRANTRALRRMAAWEKQDKKRRNVLKAIARSAS